MTKADGLSRANPKGALLESGSLSLFPWKFASGGGAQRVDGDRGTAARAARKFLAKLLLVLVAGIAWLPADAGEADGEPRERIVMGWLESVVIEPWGVKLRAKLDTGAKTSSMHAQHIERFKRKGKVWIRFTLEDFDKRTNETKVFTMERPLVREARVKSEQGVPAPRPVVSVELCLDGVMYDAEFTLTDRSNFFYRVLLGRRFLKDVALVDPNATFLTKSSRCANASKSKTKAE